MLAELVARRWASVYTALIVALFGLVVAGGQTAHAATNEILDEAAVTQLEQQALKAQPREQCYLYTEIVRDLTEMAGKQIADGNDERAQATLHRADAAMSNMHDAIKQDAKRLKNAEMLMQYTSRRLGDMMHTATGESRGVIEATLKHLDTLHTQVLAQVFSR